MSEALISRSIYPPEVALQIEAMGSMAVTIANRWQLGWPDRVGVLLTARVYLANLAEQLDQEKEMLANEANFRHLAPREVLQLFEINPAPPFLSDSERAAIPPPVDEAYRPVTDFFKPRTSRGHAELDHMEMRALAGIGAGLLMRHQGDPAAISKLCRLAVPIDSAHVNWSAKILGMLREDAEHGPYVHSHQERC
nr:hypothetical protein [uncultured Albidiferax sp.]